MFRKVALHTTQVYDSYWKFAAEIDSDDSLEQEADELARNFLIPNHFFSQVRWDFSSTADDIDSIASRARVHKSIVVGRWQREHKNYRKFARLIERGTIRQQFLRQ
jgi:HTH-type transcriptional regulator / antitoxin HigA